MISAELIHAIARLITSLFWPLIVVVIVFYFGPPIKRFLQQSEEATVSGMGLEATFKRDVESALLYGLSVAEESDLPNQMTKEQIDELISEFSTYIEPKTQEGFSQASLLWVDDTPANNVYEIETFESLGVEIDLSESTLNAIEKIRNNEYGVIISNMGRPEGDYAGYDLLERKQEIGDTTPYIIYSYPVSEEHKQMAQERGAFGSTDASRELYSMVSRALGGSIEYVQHSER